MVNLSIYTLIAIMEEHPILFFYELPNLLLDLMKSENPFYTNTVVLSACETALGKSISDEDLLRLQRSFFLVEQKQF
ncbi:MAG: CHAT domain-containing protein [Campylobacterales bacterium]|nr:CHAT domain-containing protein [Campylobacterales bacterium]